MDRDPVLAGQVTDRCGVHAGDREPAVGLGGDLGAPGGEQASQVTAARGAEVTAEPDGGLAVTGLDAATIGDLAREHGISVHELTPRHASLEEAYMELTRDSVDYRADLPDYAGKAA